MAAAIGNKYGAKERVWTQAINNVLERRNPQGRMAALEDLAAKLLEKVENGDMTAIIELANRIEGKPAQQIDLGNANNEPFRVLALTNDKEL